MIHTLTFTAGAHSGTSIGNGDIFAIEYNHSLGGYSQFSIGNVGTATVTFTSNTAFASGEKFNYYLQQMGQSNTLMGQFTIKDIKANNGRYTYTCYDNIDNFNTVVDTWFNSSSTWQNTTASALFSSLCTSLGYSSSWLAGNNNFPVSKTFAGSNINGRTILRLLAEVACANCYADTDGSIKIKSYTSNATTLNNTKYVKKQVENYTCPAIDKFTVQKYPSGDNQWLNIGSGSNILKLSESYFCYGLSDSTLTTYFNNAFSWMPSYTPMEIELQRDFGINVGDIISVDGIQTIVMQKRITSQGVELSSYGTSERSETMALNGENIDLSGYLKQSDYNSGLVNTGSYATAGVRVQGYKTIGGVNYSCNSQVSSNGLLTTATAGTVTYSAGVENNTTLPRLYLQRNTGTVAESMKITEKLIEATSSNDGNFELTTTDGLLFLPSSNYVTAVYSPSAENMWWTCGTSNVTTEPTTWSSLPSSIQHPRAIKYFVLAITNQQEGERYSWQYANTIIPAYAYGTSQTIDALAEYTPQTGGTTLTRYAARCKINFAYNQFKIWSSSASYYATLYAFY